MTNIGIVNSGKTITNQVRLILLAVACIFIAFTAGAQHPGQGKHGNHDPEARAKKQTEKMKTDLALNEQQTTQVESINLKYAKKRKELREEVRKQMKAIEEDKQKELEGVLTKDQLEKYSKAKEEQRKQRQSCKGNKKK